MSRDFLTNASVSYLKGHLYIHCILTNNSMLTA